MYSSSRPGFDWATIFLYIALVGIGVLAVYTADYDEKHTYLFDFSRSYGRQALWAGASLLVGAFILILDSRFFITLSYGIYSFSMLLLISVLVIGSVISGSKSWIETGFFNIQPSEIAKFATCLALAKYLGSLHTTIGTEREHIVTAAIIALPVMLTLMQGDAGSALVFLSLILVLYREGLSGVFLLMGVVFTLLFVLSLLLPFQAITSGIIALLTLYYLRREGLKNYRNALIFVFALIAVLTLSAVLEPIFLVILLLLTALVVTILFLNTKRISYFLLSLFFICSVYIKSVDFAFNNFLKPHQQNRIGVILGIIEDKKGVGYNLNQSKIAIGSGGLWGKGFLEGTQNKGNFVPELRTDFIFCTLAEEFGFVGSLTIIGLYLFLLLRLVELAERQRSPISRIYGYGVLSVLFFHFVINVGMTIGLVPVIGIPLPFVSYGGSALLSFSVLLFVFIKLDSEHTSYVH